MKNNIQMVLAYGSAKNKIEEKRDKMYTKVFDKTKENVIFFECYLERPVGYSGNLDISYTIYSYSQNESLPEYRKTIKVSPEAQAFTVAFMIVNRAGEHLVNGDYVAKIKIGDSDKYNFDFTITGGVPKRYGVFRTIAKLAGL